MVRVSRGLEGGRGKGREKVGKEKKEEGGKGGSSRGRAGRGTRLQTPPSAPRVFPSTVFLTAEPKQTGGGGDKTKGILLWEV